MHSWLNKTGLYNKVRNYTKLFLLLPVRRRRQIIYIQILSIITAISETANIGALIPFLGVLSDTQGEETSTLSIPGFLKNLPEDTLLIILGLSFVLLIVLSALIKSVTIRSQYRLGALISADIGKKIFNIVLHKPYEWHIKSNSSKIISILTGDVERIAGIIKAFLTLSINLLSIFVIGVFLIIYSPVLMSSTIIVFGLFYLMIFILFRKDFSAYGRERAMKYQKSIQVLQESLGGIRELIIGNQYDQFLEDYDNINRKRAIADAKIIIKASLPRYFVEGFLIVLISVISLAYVYLGYELNNLIPTLGAISLGVYKLIQPIQQCFATIGQMQSNKISLARINNLIRESKKQIYDKDELRKF